MNSWYRHGLMVLTWTHGIHMESCYIYGLMVLTTLMVLTQTHDTVNTLLHHTRMRGLSVVRVQDFL